MNPKVASRQHVWTLVVGLQQPHMHNPIHIDRQKATAGGGGGKGWRDGCKWEGRGVAFWGGAALDGETWVKAARW